MTNVQRHHGTKKTPLALRQVRYAANPDIPDDFRGRWDQYLDRRGVAECIFPEELDEILDGVVGDRISGDGHVDACDPAHCRADRTQRSVSWCHQPVRSFE